MNRGFSLGRPTIEVYCLLQLASANAWTNYSPNHPGYIICRENPGIEGVKSNGYTDSV